MGRVNFIVMAKLIIKAPGALAAEIELKPGANRFGRSLNNDFPISHPSVSSVHCEIIDTDGALMVNDLGSTNGTSLDGQPLREGPLQLGQTLRLGEVEITFAPERTANPALRVATVNAPPPPAPSIPRLPPAIPMRRKVNFYKSIPGAFVFPCRRNGLILLLSGTAFFVIMNYLSGAAGMVGAGVGLFSCGYLFAFVLSIINTTAMGQEEMPGWPDFDGWWESGIFPSFQLFGILAVCFAPAILYGWLAKEVEIWALVLLWIAGLLYLPMALLAVAMYDSLAALNPMLIVASILRVPLEYAVTCLALGFLLLVYVMVSNVLMENLHARLLASIAEHFLFFYTLTLVARLAGLLFYTTKKRLGWPMGKD
jgi:pSer/pThr/pTyr-binding forkhead associated (FHA) protein